MMRKEMDETEYLRTANVRVAEGKMVGGKRVRAAWPSIDLLEIENHKQNLKSQRCSRWLSLDQSFEK
jgi:hypothetical protein